MADTETNKVSADKSGLKVSCPSCGTIVRWTEEFPHRPFCSKRCQLTDFGEWAYERHRISGEQDDDQLSDESFQDY